MLGNWAGHRDRALLILAVQTGLRASELLNLRCDDITLGPVAFVRCQGKGRNCAVRRFARTHSRYWAGWGPQRHVEHVQLVAVVPRLLLGSLYGRSHALVRLGVFSRQRRACPVPR